MTQADAIAERTSPPGGDVVRRHRLSTRIWHWINAVTFFIMLMSGLMIFNAHPRLYWGQYGANSDPAWLEIGSVDGPRLSADRRRDARHHRRPRRRRRSTGGCSARAFPGWATIPSNYNLALSRRWHLTFAWVFALGIVGLRPLEPRQRPPAARPAADSRRARAPRTSGRTSSDHATLNFPKGEAARRYNVLQKLAYLRGDPGPDPADGPDRAHHVAGHGRDLALAARPLRRAAVGALDPLHRRRRCSSPSSSCTWSWWCSPDRSTRSAR